MRLRCYKLANNPFFQLIAVGVIIFLGCNLRLNDLEHWRMDNSGAFHEGEPGISTLDGYYYAAVARDIQRGTYGRQSIQQRFPDTPERREFPPLLSVLTAAAASLFSTSINWTAVYLPVILGCLLALPMYSLGRHFGGIGLGSLFALYSILPLHYVYRTRPGWLDTDCLILVLSYSSVYVMYMVTVTEGHRRALFAGLGLTLLVTLIAWWDQTIVAPAVLGGYPIFAALGIVALGRWPSLVQDKRLLLVGSSVLAAVVFTAGSSLGLISEGMRLLGYLTNADIGPFPNPSTSISEQASPTLSLFAQSTTGNIWTFFLAIVGLALLLGYKRRLAVFLLPHVLLGFFGLLIGKRFMLFASPLLAMGAGYLVYWLWLRRAQFYPLYVIAPAIFVLFLGSLIQQIRQNHFYPSVTSEVVAGLDLARQRTEPNAIIWSWWDNGYPIQFVADRATISDGRFHSGELLFYTAAPLATDSAVFARNFIRFYATHGQTGMSSWYSRLHGDVSTALEIAWSIFATGKENAATILTAAQYGFDTAEINDLVEFFFPAPSRPIYLFLDFNMMRTAYWWHWYGTWDTTRQHGKNPVYQEYVGVEMRDRKLYGFQDLRVDVANKVLSDRNGRFALKAIYVHDQGEKPIVRRGTNGDYNLDVFLPGKFAVMSDDDMQRSLFNKMFVKNEAPSPLFEPVFLNSPMYQLWKIL